MKLAGVDYRETIDELSLLHYNEDEAATEAAQQTENASAQTTESANEQVIDDTTPGNALHTESDEDDERIEVRQDFMDRVNEDIENDSDQN